LRERFGDQIQIERRAFALRPTPDASVQFRGTYREAGWQRIATMVKPDGIVWKMWEREDYPHWSLPALEAAKCAALQSDEAFAGSTVRVPWRSTRSRIPSNCRRAMIE
jgi:hypothetical protein